MRGLSEQVYQALSPAHGGCVDVSVAEVVARMARAKVGKSYGSAREALLLSAKFVTAQLQAAGDAAPFISSLTAEVSGAASNMTAQAKRSVRRQASLGYLSHNAHLDALSSQTKLGC